MVLAQKAKLRNSRGTKVFSIKQSEPISLEDVALQAIYDLAVCHGIFSRLVSDSRAVSTAVRNLKKCTSDWADAIDPVNAQLLLPLVEAKAALYLSRAHLLFPGIRESSTGDGSTSGQESSIHNFHSQLSTSNAMSSVVEGVFTSSASSRFSLLPLPMNSASKAVNGSGGPHGIDGADEARREDGNDDSIGSVLQKGIASAASSTSMSAAKSFIGNIGNSFNKLGLGL